jgi:hypothetical protein
LAEGAVGEPPPAAFLRQNESVGTAPKPSKAPAASSVSRRAPKASPSAMPPTAGEIPKSR